MITGQDKSCRMLRWASSFALLTLIVSLFLSGQGPQATEQEGPAFSFLSESSVWEGEFANLVNQGDGIIQKGRIRIKVNVDDNRIIHMKIALVKPDGTPGDYDGMAEMRLLGNKLTWEGEMIRDPSNNNRIENHIFEGNVAPAHIYILETYDDIGPGGQRDKRRNDLHYCFFEEGKAVMLGGRFCQRPIAGLCANDIEEKMRARQAQAAQGLSTE